MPRTRPLRTARLPVPDTGRANGYLAAAPDDVPNTWSTTAVAAPLPRDGGSGAQESADHRHSLIVVACGAFCRYGYYLNQDGRPYTGGRPYGHLCGAHDAGTPDWCTNMSDPDTDGANLRDIQKIL